ncbi:hypothetical protein [Bradyrhizobium sp. JR3.5]
MTKESCQPKISAAVGVCPSTDERDRDALPISIAVIVAVDRGYARSASAKQQMVAHAEELFAAGIANCGHVSDAEGAAVRIAAQTGNEVRLQAATGGATCSSSSYHSSQTHSIGTQAGLPLKKLGRHPSYIPTPVVWQTHTSCKAETHPFRSFD